MKTIKKWFLIATELYKANTVFRIMVLSQAILVSLIIFVALISHPENIKFSYSGNSCINSFVILPETSRLRQGSDYSVIYKNNYKIAGRVIVSTKTCIAPNSIPSENSDTKLVLDLFKVPLFSKAINVATPQRPKLSQDLNLIKNVSTTEPLNVELNSKDTIFNYVLFANNLQAECRTENGLNFSCDTAKLSLLHASLYDFSLMREFNKQDYQTVSSAKIATANPVNITKSSITGGSTVYDSPKLITLETDKNINNVKGVVLKQKNGPEVAIVSSYSNNKITLEFTSELLRGKEYILSVGNVASNEGGSLTNPYELNFTMSLGPKVLSTNIGKSGIDVNQNITVNFDQALLINQDFSKLVKININNASVLTKISLQSNKLIIDPISPLPMCSVFTLKIDTGILSFYNIKAESVWEYSARTNCFESFSIGTSKEGRGIIAYRYGNSPNPLLFVANLHGDEKNTKTLLDKWIAEVNANPQKLPTGKSIVVIPLLNPDGYAKSTRTNSNNIDLNRNFPANNWKSEVKQPSGVIMAQGGGATALSEPESQSLASYVQNINPSFVMSYHSMGGVAIANDAANSRALASIYASKSGYVYKNGDNIGTFFDYDTTGAFEDWLHDKQGTGAILVELNTRYDDEFGRNIGAMWSITQSY